MEASSAFLLVVCGWVIGPEKGREERERERVKRRKQPEIDKNRTETATEGE
jgi:hypothetical protein